MSDSPDALRRMMVIEFSVNGAQLEKLDFASLREHCRKSIYKAGVARHRFQGSAFSYDEAFQQAFNERLDRRSVPRDLPEPEGDDE